MKRLFLLIFSKQPISVYSTDLIDNPIYSIDYYQEEYDYWVDSAVINRILTEFDNQLDLGLTKENFDVYYDLTDDQHFQRVFIRNIPYYKEISFYVTQTYPIKEKQGDYNSLQITFEYDEDFLNSIDVTKETTLLIQLLTTQDNIEYLSSEIPLYFENEVDKNEYYRDEIDNYFIRLKAEFVVEKGIEDDSRWEYTVHFRIPLDNVFLPSETPNLLTSELDIHKEELIIPKDNRGYSMLDYTVFKKLEERFSEFNYSNYDTYEYQDILRDRDGFKFEMFYSEGKILQYEENIDHAFALLKINDDIDEIMYLEFDELPEKRLLEDDIVYVFGKLDGLVDYKTVLGDNKTVPSLVIDYYAIEGIDY